MALLFLSYISLIRSFSPRTVLAGKGDRRCRAQRGRSHQSWNHDAVITTGPHPRAQELEVVASGNVSLASLSDLADAANDGSNGIIITIIRPL
jgi:hypothetical protein